MSARVGDSLCSSDLVHGMCEWSALCLWSLYPWSEWLCLVDPRRFGRQWLGSQPWAGLGPAFPTRVVAVAIWDSSIYFCLFVLLLITACTRTYCMVRCRRHFHTHTRARTHTHTRAHARAHTHTVHLLLWMCAGDFFSSKCRNPFWGPPSLSIQGVPGFFTRGKTAGTWSWPLISI
jgi:hypothetical protein